MKKIKLTQKQFALVDDEDFEELNKHKWYCHSQGRYNKVSYAIRQKTVAFKTKAVERMHRVIMNPPSGMDVDHIDHNGLNNQKSNLRVCSRAQNMKNKRVSTIKKSSKYKGVHLMTGYVEKGYSKRWTGAVGGKNYGYFETEEEAAKMYNIKAKEKYGDFACLNILSNLK